LAKIECCPWRAVDKKWYGFVTHLSVYQEELLVLVGALALLFIEQGFPQGALFVPLVVFLIELVRLTGTYSLASRKAHKK
jgi:hypothetical protein